METYRQEGRQFLAGDLARRIGSHWVRLILLMLAFAVLLGGWRYYKDDKAANAANASLLSAEEPEEAARTVEEVEAEIARLSDDQRVPLERMVYLSGRIDDLRAYSRTSKLMQIDAGDVAQLKQLFFVRAQDDAFGLKEGYVNSINSQELRAQIVASVKGYTEKDIQELLNVSSTSELTLNGQNLAENENFSLSVTIRGETEQDVRAIGRVVKSYFERYSARLAGIFGEHTLTLVDEYYSQGGVSSISDLQSSIYDEIDTLQTRQTTLFNAFSDEQKQLWSEYVTARAGQMPDDPALPDEQIDAIPAKASLSPKWVLIGALLGAVISVLLDVLAWMAGGRLNSAEDLEQNLDLPVYGVLESGRKKAWPVRLMDRRKKKLSPEESYRMITTGIALKAQQTGKSALLLTGSEMDAKYQATFERLQKDLAAQGVQLRVGGSIAADPDSLAALAGSEGVILFEEAGASRFRAILREVQTFTRQGACLMGAIVAER